MPQKLKSTAFHEAGHAVMCWCEGVAVQKISIVQLEEIDSLDPDLDNGSHCHIEIRQKPKNRNRMEKLVKVCLAGPIAQRRYRPRSHWRADGELDYTSAMELISAYTGSDRETEAYLQLLEIQTQQELEHENVWMRVEALASELLEKKALTSHRIRAILKQPPVSAKRLEQIMKYAMPIPFSNISRIEVDLTETGPATGYQDRSRGFVWPQTYVDSIQCSNASLCAGGLDLTQMVSQMIQERQVEEPIDESCTGTESHGRCETSFTGFIRLSYID